MLFLFATVRNNLKRFWLWLWFGEGEPGNLAYGEREREWKRGSSFPSHADCYSVHCTGLMAILKKKGFKQLCFSELLEKRGLFFPPCLLPYCCGICLSFIPFEERDLLCIVYLQPWSLLWNAIGWNYIVWVLLPAFFLPLPLSLTDSFEARQEQGWPIYRASLSLPCIHLNENKELLFCSDLGRHALMLFLRIGLKIYCYC